MTWSDRAFSLIELLMVFALLATLGAIVMPQYMVIVEDAKELKAGQQILHIQESIDTYKRQHGGNLPASLGELDGVDLLDPWGNPYQYLIIERVGKGGGKGSYSGSVRRDRWQVPLNTDYDLYSMGPDGKSTTQIGSGAGRDDIIRAANGSYIGKALEF